MERGISRHFRALTVAGPLYQAKRPEQRAVRKKAIRLRVRIPSGPTQVRPLGLLSFGMEREAWPPGCDGMPRAREGVIKRERPRCCVHLQFCAREHAGSEGRRRATEWRFHAPRAA